ncbi:MAG: hypothetical protein IT371_18590 [Deltaproteobacteria bacterium]|nr:hypothetical protein [Deltaproteobacteria bacterium]
MLLPEPSALLRRLRREPLFGELPRRLDWGRDALVRLLPHRPPLLLVDHLLGADEAGGRARGDRWLDPADPIFAGHFPEEPIYPGALLLEAAGQLGLCLGEPLARGTLPERPASVRLIRVHGAEFVGAARPGDTLTLLAELLEDDGWTVRIAGQVLRSNEILCAVMLEALRGET